MTPSGLVSVSFVLVIALYVGVDCAPLTRSENKDKPKDLTAAANVIELDQLDPRNQAVYSSYSIVETAGGSTGPNRVKFTKNEYEPAGQNTEHKPVSGHGGRPDRRKKFKFDDDDSSSFSSSSDYKPASSEQVSRPKSKPSRKSSSAKSSPKSINEIVEQSAPLQEAGSSKKSTLSGGDLSKEGSYLSGSLGDGFEEGYDKEKHFDKEGGKKFIEAHKAEAGEKAQQGYKKEEGFDKAEDAKHGKEEKKAVVSEKEGEKKGHLEQEKTTVEEYKGKDGEKGISVTKKGGHKKGHKKTGFHKVHHKDEYKKDEVFYDDAHSGDEHEEHAHEHEKHHKEKGGSAKKNNVDSGYHEGHGEKKGVQNKGHHFEEASGHKKEAGQEAHHDKKSEYAKKGGVKEGEKHGHAEGGSHGGGYADHGFF